MMIDLDKDFRLFASRLLRERGEVKEEDTESFLNEATEKWLGRGNELLDGLTPDEYFEKMAPEALIGWLTGCLERGWEVPEPLYRRVKAVKECEGLLAALAAGSGSDELRSTALSLLIDMDSVYADKACVVNALRGGSASEIAAERLKRAPDEAVMPLIDAYESADDALRAVIIDILVRHPNIESARRLLEERLLSDRGRRAFYAACASALGDSSLIGALSELAASDDVDYIDYMEIANAIEALGGEPDFEREFYGDRDYERMRNYTSDD